MLHIATVHYGFPDWIEIQTRYLREQISIPYRTWTSLESIDPSYADKFDHVVDQTGRHSDKLNHLAMEISHEAADEDLLMFLDGDAFPIADPLPLIESGLATAPLVAVRRAENVNDLQPHPCFCVTTVRAWRELGGDWSPGYRWVDAMGRRVSDVGGNLLRKLELTSTPWVEVLRSNRRNLDPIFFGIYGDTIYHHGAGFRGGELTRAHYALAPKPRALTRVPLGRRIARRVDWEKRRSWERRTTKDQMRRSRLVLDKIEQPGSNWLAEFI